MSNITLFEDSRRLASLKKDAEIMSNKMDSMSTSSRVANDLRHEYFDLVRDFWLAFPCPPPWRPRLLAEVNASSRLEPGVGRRVQAFLAGKCHLQHVFSASELHPAVDLDIFGGHGHENIFDEVIKSGDRNDVLESDEATSAHAKDQSWCDSGCQLGLACAVILAVIVVLVVTIVCILSPQHGDLRFSGPPSGQSDGVGARTPDRIVNADIKTDSLFTVPPTPR
ncbi:hypothetical protein PoB_004310000 [Plakobranchus ocellatus]|uniref:Uncharacterized protein n=1 Tax=Plakobranchus ocellatus TaxID=259542 RepID=A0AAV4BAP6_9GAST|nr:hypothetical protein PoB_004310000 [Plakobranchus ocellatus]